jgi:hypothetical protein
VGRKTHALPVLCILALFASSRVAAWAAGVRFDASTLAYFWQIVDPILLKTRLFESVWYLHAQPPLYNLVIGVGLKIFGSHFATAAHASQICLGLVIMLSLYALLVVVGLRRWWAAALTSLFATSPAMLLFENWLFYEYPVVTLLLLAALAFAWFERNPTASRSFAVFAPLAALCFMRSTFQIPFLLLALALMLTVFSHRRRAILIGAAVPLALVAGLYLKNWAVFETPMTSSWAGMNLMQVAYYGMSAADHHDLAQRGILSPVSTNNPFRPLDVYAGLVPPAPPRGVRVLDDSTKPTSGVPNFNNIQYVSISKRYLHDFSRLVVHRPDIYFSGIQAGLKIGSKPSSDYYFFADNRKHLTAWERVFNAAVFWQPHIRWTGGEPGGRAWGLVAYYLAALCFGAVETLRVLRRRGGSATLAFVWMLMTYAVLVMTLGESAENQRVRFVTDPLVTILVAGLALGVVSRVARRRSVRAVNDGRAYSSTVSRVP